MKVTTLDEKSIRDIGHAFGYYDYEEETGMTAAFSGKEATANYICAYVRGVLRGGFLYTTSERGEGYIAYKLPKEKMGLKTMLNEPSGFSGGAAEFLQTGMDLIADLDTQLLNTFVFVLKKLRLFRHICGLTPLPTGGLGAVSEPSSRRA